MKSKEEILSAHCSIDGQFYDKETEIDCHSESVHDSMEEYAKEVSIAFRKWCEINEYANSAALGRSLTDDELYNYYKHNIFPSY